VIAIDLDLRHPRLGQLLCAASEPGFVDVVLERADLHAALQPIMNGQPATDGAASESDYVSAGSLHFIASGVLAPNPAALVVSHTLGKLITGLKRRADVILIDSPPLLTVGDGIALAAQVDALLAVMRLGDARRPLVTEFRRVLQSLPVPTLGVAVTDVPANTGYGAYTYESHPMRSARAWPLQVAAREAWARVRSGAPT
jgi:Mrp family chromosome partitioning ATPase